MRVHAVVFGFGHFFHAANDNGLPIGIQYSGYGATFFIGLHGYIGGVEPCFFAVRAFAVIGCRQHHALCEQLFKRLAHGHDALVVHQLGKETRVKQVQNGVFNAADVLVNLLPIRRRFGRDHAAVKLGRHITELIPAGFHKSVHGVGFAPRRTAAAGALGFVELGHFGQRRACAVGDNVFRQHHGQILLGHGHIAAAFAMDDGNGAAPIALARNAPIAQAVLGFRFTRACGLQFCADGIKGSLKIQTVKLAAVNQFAVFFVGIPILPCLRVKRVITHGNHLLNRQTIGMGKGKIALIVRRHRHHRAIAVAPQHIICHPHFQLLAVERVNHKTPCWHAFFLHGCHIGFGNAARLAFGDERLQFGLIGGGCGGQRMFGGNGNIGCAHQRVGARSVYL